MRSPTAGSPIVVFVGPSLPHRVRPVSDVLTWRPPAARGDLDELDLPSDARVVLVDGYLIHQHPPSPTEVFRLVQRNHEVWGCSSLGALRAAELREHGMRGSGWIYDRVLDRTITCDDELVAPLDPRTDEAAGVFLANIRFALEQLLVAKRASRAQARFLIDTLGAVHFAQRTSDRCRDLGRSAGLEDDAIASLLASDVKRQDAAVLIRRLTNSGQTT